MFLEAKKKKIEAMVSYKTHYVCMFDSDISVGDKSMF